MLVLAAIALAADVTDMPPRLGGDASFEYHGTWAFSSIEEGGESFGSERLVRQDIRFGAEFAPVEGASLWLRIDATPSIVVRFLDPRSMVYDPVTETGTYFGGDRLRGDRTLRGAGLEGVWIGGAVAPFAERYGRGQGATWRLDAAVRTPDAQHTFFTAIGEQRGAAPGGVGVLLAGAFSARRGPAEPYLAGHFTWEGRARVDVIDEQGRNHAEALLIDPGDRVDVRGGVELVAGENPDTGERFSVDFHGAFAYVAPAEVPSGVLLPGALERTDGLQATQGDRIEAGGGLYARYAPVDQFLARFGVDGWWATPARIEHFTPATTGFDSVGVTVSVGLEGRLR